MSRTTPSKVRGIIEGVEEDFDLDPFIETANMLVSAMCAPLGYTSSQLEVIERWLAAHFYSCDHSRLLEEVIGRSREMIEGKVGMGLQLTHHGQQVALLDYLGGLTSVASGTVKRVRMRWLGRTRAERGL